MEWNKLLKNIPGVLLRQHSSKQWVSFGPIKIPIALLRTISLKFRATKQITFVPVDSGPAGCMQIKYSLESCRRTKDTHYARLSGAFFAPQII